MPRGEIKRREHGKNAEDVEDTKIMKTRWRFVHWKLKSSGSSEDGTEMRPANIETTHVSHESIERDDTIRPRPSNGDYK